jgi:hypothetical protein
VTVRQVKKDKSPLLIFILLIPLVLLVEGVKKYKKDNFLTPGGVLLER